MDSRRAPNRRGGRVDFEVVDFYSEKSLALAPRRMDFEVVDFYSEESVALAPRRET